MPCAAMMVFTPTPLRPLAGHDHLWVKDESAIHPSYGGNKVRKLERILADARGHDAVVTSGGAGSHHVLATALLAAEQGLATHAVLFEQALSTDALAHAHAIVGRCASVTTCPDPYAAHAAVRRLAERHRAYSIPVGGSSVEGTLGWVAGGHELANQIAAGAMPPPEAIYVPSASGGTAVGLQQGLADIGLTCPVIAVRIGRFLTGRRLRELVARVAARRGQPPGPVPRLVPAMSPRGRSHAPRLDLDPTYTAPAFATCLADRPPGPTLFVHTASRAAPPAEVRPLPAKVAALFVVPKGARRKPPEVR